MGIISDRIRFFHPSYSHRILYVGLDLKLLEFLQGSLESCQIIRCPIGSVARILIKELKYSVIISDEELMDTSGLELAHFARTIEHHAHTPIILLSDTEYDSEVILCKASDFELIVETIIHLLGL